MKITEGYTIEKTESFTDSIDCLFRTEDNAFIFYIGATDLDYYEIRDELETFFVEHVWGNPDYQLMECVIQGQEIEYYSIIDAAQQIILGLKLR